MTSHELAKKLLEEPNSPVFAINPETGLWGPVWWIQWEAKIARLHGGALSEKDNPPRVTRRRKETPRD